MLFFTLLAILNIFPTILLILPIIVFNSQSIKLMIQQRTLAKKKVQ